MNRNSGKGSTSSYSHTPTRSGIGLDMDEWEAPERLSTSIKRVNSTPSSGVTTVDKQSKSSSNDEWEKATPLRSSRSVGESSTLTASSTRSKTVLNSKLLDRLGFNNVASNNPQDAYDPNEEDDEFDRDFYLSEEGQTMGIEGCY